MSSTSYEGLPEDGPEGQHGPIGVTELSGLLNRAAAP
jgi:hypothetical protein